MNSLQSSPPVGRPATAKAVLELPAHSGPVGALAFTPDRSLLVSADRSGAARIWNVSSSRSGTRGAVEKLGDHFRAIAFAPNSRLVVLGAGTLSGLVWMYDITESSPVEGATLRGARGAVGALAFSADGKLIAGGGEDCTLRVWEPGPGFRGDPRTVLPGHTQPIEAVVFAPDGHTIATGSRDGTARVWTISRIRSSQRAVLPHPAGVDAVAYLPDGRSLVTGCRDGRVRVWDLTAVVPTVRIEFAGPASGTRGLVVASGELLAGAGDGSAVTSWDPRTGRVVAVWEVPGGAGTSAALTPDGRYLARGTAAGTVGLFRVAEKRA